jgi:hypothetical protein
LSIKKDVPNEISRSFDFLITKTLPVFATVPKEREKLSRKKKEREKSCKIQERWLPKIGLWLTAVPGLILRGLGWTVWAVLKFRL